MYRVYIYIFYFKCIKIRESINEDFKPRHVLE